MHYALAGEVRVNDEEAQQDLQAIARTAQDARLPANEVANTGLMNLARDPIITSLVNTSRSLQVSLREANENLRETRLAFNELAALVARCQSCNDAMDMILSLQSNIEELRSQVACPPLYPVQPANGQGDYATPTCTIRPLAQMNTIQPATPPPKTTSGQLPMGSTPPVIPQVPLLSASVPATPNTGLSMARAGASFNPPLTSFNKGKRPADRPVECGSSKKTQTESTVVVVMGYTKAVGHPVSIAQSIMQTLKLSPLDLVSANWKKGSKGFIKMHFCSAEAATTYTMVLNANNTNPDLPELHGLCAEVVDDAAYDTAGSYAGSFPGPSNPAPSTR
ncbi:hypothetical protein PM082_009396 [Marasmius tenuissimus]|nr:hypothetical protein PM082_009396 [Marasmius tenuissimus]